MIALSDIQSIVHGHVAMNEPMEKYTWMRVGGPADFYLEPAGRDELIAVLRYFGENRYPVMMIGRGSNMLVSDDGIRGAVVNVEGCLSDISMDGDLVVAQAGARLTKFVDFCVQRGLAGVEMLAGIPGTVGGAIVMNAGAHGGETADHLVDVEVLRQGALLWVKKEQGQFAYRRSGFTGDTVLTARFRLPAGDTEALAKRRKELIQKRNATQPLELPNLGSMFKNPPNNFAAKLIEDAGLKGKKVGQAQVSEKHANFMVNLGGATAADVVRLIDIVRRTVYQRSGIMLELEVKLVGFPDDVKALVA